MGRHECDPLADGPVSVPSVESDEEETIALGVKLFCAIGALLGSTTSRSSPRSSRTVDWRLTVFTGFGVLCGWLLYGLWTRRRWAWFGAMCWFALVGTLSIATIQYGHAAICFLLLAYLDSVEETFEDSSGFYT